MSTENGVDTGGGGLDRRMSSASHLDVDKMARLQQLKGNLASKLLKMKVSPEESAAAAISLSKVMARKKGAELLQIDIETEAQWKLLLRKEGLIVVEVYSAWCGPCLSMTSFLKKLKGELNEDRLTLATVNSELVGDVRIFRGQSEPTWIFMGGGKPVRLIRGPNSATLTSAIRSELAHELLCLDGKAKRNLISLKDEAERRHKAKSEAILLASIQKKLESEQSLIPEPVPITKRKEKTPDPAPGPPEEVMEQLSPGQEDAAISSEVDGTLENVQSESDPTVTLPEPEIVDTPPPPPLRTEYVVDAAAESLQNRLLTSLDSFTVLAIQGFLLETGAVTEIKDHLKEEFKILNERYITLDETGVRRLYGIPTHYQELIEEEEEEEETKEGGGSMTGEEEEDKVSEVESSQQMDTGGGEGEENSHPEGEEVVEDEIRKPREPQYREVSIPLAPDILGDSLLFLLQSLEVVRAREADPEVTLAKNADDLLRFRVGPRSYADAVNNEPKSLLATYGREEYSVGIWCPRRVEDKKSVMLNYFPKLVMELLLPPPKQLPKYMVAIFPALFSHEIMEQAELVTNPTSVLGQGVMKLSSKFVDRILKSHGLLGEDLDAQKRALTGFDMFAVVIDERNEALSSALASLEPLHYSVNEDNGRYESAQLFPHLNILIDTSFEEELYRKEAIVEKFLARPKIKLNVIFDDELLNLDEAGSPLPQ